MSQDQPRIQRRQDYRPPAFFVEETELLIQLDGPRTRVRSRLVLRRNPEVEAGPLELDGVGLTLEQLRVDGRQPAADSVRQEPERLVLTGLPETCVVETCSLIDPDGNDSLEGLYRSGPIYATQCEAEGFRKITWYPDRPDVLSVYRVRIEADQERCPVLLANGNPVAAGELPDGRHYAEWHDPFPKPSYLFAVVAGDLAHVEDEFVTASGRRVALRLYVEARDLDKCDHAMAALKAAMAWDEEVYGREYDLDRYHIVAVDDFNLGAMENKGLNLFNTSCVLARPDTTTDATYQRIEAIVGHEYFHNWSGNRVTCRDWFQLSLKEGLTVFREAAFAADRGSPTVQRIADVQYLRTAQFAEDSGPMAHPVRPDSYMEIANFYTVTIYEKGAEVVGMLHQLLGPETFRRGTDLYFDRFDGQAVTCEDFLQCMAEVSGRDLSVFERWYSQAGTPVLEVRGDYDAATGRYGLTVRQSCPPTPGQPDKLPFHIPLRMALLGEAGALRLVQEGVPPDPDSEDNTELVLEITEAEQRFVFLEVGEEPVPSLLRGFSAPVRLDFPYTRDQLAFLFQRDGDGFSRWEAGHQLACLALEDLVAAWQSGDALELEPRLLDTWALLLAEEGLDPALTALMLELPSESYLAERSPPADVAAIHAARGFARQRLATVLETQLRTRYRALASDEPYRPEPGQMAARSLRNACLGYLLELGRPEDIQAAWEQFVGSDNMTDTLAALTGLARHTETEGQRALEQFYQRWQDEPLVVNQWLQVQAAVPGEATLARVQTLLEHPAYEARNPNKVRALLGTFSQHNPSAFHRADGAGHRFLADQVAALDGSNPQLAARLLTPLTRWRSYQPRWAESMRTALQELMEQPLSTDVYEVVSKSLA